MAIAEHQYFRTKDGKILTNIEELGRAIKEMEDHTYHHHVSHDKNDFANWVEGVFSEKELAKHLRQAKNKKEMSDLLIRHDFKKVVERTDEDLMRINERLESIMMKNFSLDQKEKEIEKIEEKIEKDLSRMFGMREFLFLLLGFSFGIMFMALMKALKIF